MDPVGQPARHRLGVRTGRQLSANTGAWCPARPAVDREPKSVLMPAAVASPDTPPPADHPPTRLPGPGYAVLRLRQRAQMLHLQDLKSDDTHHVRDTAQNSRSDAAHAVGLI